MYGGAAGTSYHDVIIFSGARDIASEAGFSGWPQYRAEDILRMNPAYIVCPQGGAEALSAISALKHFPVIEVNAGVINDPGFAVVEAAQHVASALVQQESLSDAEN